MATHLNLFTYYSNIIEKNKTVIMNLNKHILDKNKQCINLFIHFTSTKDLHI